MTNRTFGILIVIGVFGLFMLIRYAILVNKLIKENVAMKNVASDLQKQNSRLGFEVRRLSVRG